MCCTHEFSSISAYRILHPSQCTTFIHRVINPITIIVFIISSFLATAGSSNSSGSSSSRSSEDR
jgi:hypothetical protein